LTHGAPFGSRWQPAFFSGPERIEGRVIFIGQ
jgi:hypothetical protein